MKDLTVTEKYLIVSLTDRGKLPLLGVEVPSCLVVAGLFDMVFDGVVEIGVKKRLKAVKELPDNLSFLRCLYDMIVEKQKLTPDKLVSEFVLTFTGKRLTNYLKAVAGSLAEKGLADLEKDGEVCFPKEGEKDKIIQEIRAELLEDGVVSKEIVLLTALMYKGQQIKKYFSKYEADCLKKRIKEIKETEVGELVSEAVDYITCLIVVAAT